MLICSTLKVVRFFLHSLCNFAKQAISMVLPLPCSRVDFSFKTSPWRQTSSVSLWWNGFILSVLIKNVFPSIHVVKLHLGQKLWGPSFPQISKGLNLRSSWADSNDVDRFFLSKVTVLDCFQHNNHPMNFVQKDLNQLYHLCQAGCEIFSHN